MRVQISKSQMDCLVAVELPGLDPAFGQELGRFEAFAGSVDLAPSAVVPFVVVAAAAAAVANVESAFHFAQGAFAVGASVVAPDSAAFAVVPFSTGAKNSHARHFVEPCSGQAFRLRVYQLVQFAVGAFGAALVFPFQPDSPFVVGKDLESRLDYSFALAGGLTRGLTWKASAAAEDSAAA